MKEEKKTLTDIICGALTLILVVTVPILSFVMVRQREAEYFALYERYRNVREEYAEEYAELSTAYEFMEDLYSEQQDTIDRLKAIIDRLLSEEHAEQDTYSEEFVEQMYSDKVLYSFYKLEPDGDFELFWENDKGWAYVEYLGGEQVEVKEFIGATEQDIIDFIGIRMCEFDYTESLESKGSLF